VRIRSTLLSTILALTVAHAAYAQNDPATGAKPATIPVKATITISRYQGEKKTSSLPYALSLNVSPDRPTAANLRMGNRLPIRSTTTGGGTPVPTVSYEDVGTNIDCTVNPPENGAFRVSVTVEESSVYDDGGKSAMELGRPTLRSFRTTGAVMLKDGQSLQLSNTPDRLTGDRVTVDVMLTVVK
jgi:hypothetical protein